MKRDIEYTLLFSMQNPPSSCRLHYHQNSLSSYFAHSFKLTNTVSFINKTMELFLELAFTIVVSLLLPLFFIKLLSLTPNSETNERAAVIGRDRDQVVQSDSQIWETEEVGRIVGKFDEFRDKAEKGKLIAMKIDQDINCASARIVNKEKIDESNENEVADLEENSVEEDSHEVEVEEVDLLQFGNDCNEIDECKSNGEVDDENMSLLDEEEWEGIERTELERCFGAAVVFVGSKNNANNRVAHLSNDVKMKLYGYHRIATQGPCREPQPMALKFSARAKWNAWQQLGIMSPELAMERYISLLSQSIPDWMANYTNENVKSAPADILAFAKLTL